MSLPRTGKVVYIASLFTWAAVLRGSERSIWHFTSFYFTETEANPPFLFFFGNGSLCVMWLIMKAVSGDDRSAHKPCIFCQGLPDLLGWNLIRSWLVNMRLVYGAIIHPCVWAVNLIIYSNVGYLTCTHLRLHTGYSCIMQGKGYKHIRISSNKVQACPKWNHRVCSRALKGIIENQKSIAIPSPSRKSETPVLRFVSGIAV